MIRSLIYSLVIIAIATTAVAQPLSQVPYEMMLETADEMLEMNDYYRALEWYEKAYKVERDKDTASRIAYIRYKMRDFDSANKNYKRLFARAEDSIRFADQRFLYGKSLKAQGQFQDAAAQFAIHIQSTTDEKEKEKARNEIKGMKIANELEQNIDVVVNFGGNEVNTAYTEGSPRLHNDGTLYFSAIRGRKVIETEGNNEDQFSKIYTSTFDTEEGEYQEPEALESVVNREGWHTNNPSFSKDGNRMYFTRSKLYGNELDISNLYASIRDGSKWGPAQPLGGIDDEALTRHPAVGELFGDEVLFFSSDMEGGFGGFDLYYTTIRGTSDYAPPVNLGPGINTAQDEITPFYLDGVLYFSSEGLPTIGGFDSFKSTWDGTNWSAPENMGLNYNSTYDDMFLSFSPSGTKGFLISNRLDDNKRSLKSKTCCDDIYAFNIREIVMDLLAVVEDEKGALNGATVILEDQSKAKAPETKMNSEGNNFNFLLDSERTYKAYISRDGYYPDTIDFNTIGILDDFTVKKRIILEPIPAAPTEPAEPEYIIETVTMNEAIRLNNIYYDLDDAKILPDAEQDLRLIQGLMNEYSDMVIELSSHTDSQGNTPYNRRLSQRRAESARNWLIEQGVAEDRIVPKGYGEEFILNRCVNGTRCPDEEHRFNRRTEFKIIAGPQTIEIKKEVKKQKN